MHTQEPTSIRALASKLVLLALALCLLAAPSASAQTVQLTQFGSANFTYPFYVAGDPTDPNRVFVVEAAGRIHLVENGVTQTPAFLDIDPDVLDIEETGCECGMFSMAFAPGYANNRHFYVFYTQDDPTMGNEHFLVIEEFRRDANNPDIADPAYRREVLRINHFTNSNHNGGQLQFGQDGLLYISTGDGGGTPQFGQDLDTLLGKVLRINPTGTMPGDYTIPGTNPFVGGAGRDEIYAYGLRNPYRFSFDRVTGDFTLGDVGSSIVEEVDFTSPAALRGANFGWQCYEGTQVRTMGGECNPLPSNHTPPAIEYARLPMGAAAVSGGYVVRDLTVPSLVGHYLYSDTYGALGNNVHSALLSSGVEEGPVPGLSGVRATNIVSFGEDACAHVYVTTYNGHVSRIEPTSGPPACMPQLPPSPPATPAADTSAPGLTVDGRRGRRAAAAGLVRLIVGCDEDCTVAGEGKIVLPGKDIPLAPDQGSLAAGATGALDLGLPEGTAARLLAALRDGAKAKAKVGITSSDAAGNRRTVTKRIRQKR